MSSARLTDTAIGGNASCDGSAGTLDRGDAACLSAGQDDDLVARAHHTAGHGARIAAVVVMVEGLRPDHVLNRESNVDEVAVAGDVHLFEMGQQRRSVVPRGVIRLGHHIVAEQRRQRNRGHVMDVQPGCELMEVVADLLELFTVPADQVHLVDRQHDVPDAQQRRQERVAAGLLEQPVAGVDQARSPVARSRRR